MRILDVMLAVTFGLTVALFVRPDSMANSVLSYSNDWNYVVGNTNSGARQCVSMAPLESPVCVQWGIHELFVEKDIDNPEIFSAWDNAYRSFRESGVRDRSFSYDDGVVTMRIKASLSNAMFDGELIHMDGVVSQSGLTIQLGHGYELVTTRYQSASVRECRVLIRPFEMHVTGEVNNLLQLFNSSGRELVFNGEFALLADGLPECDTSDTDGYVLDVDYSYIIRRISDGLEVAYGCR